MSLDVLLRYRCGRFRIGVTDPEVVDANDSMHPLSDQLTDGHHDSADVAIIDARTDLAAARSVCRSLTANTPAIAVVAVVAPGDFACG